jgi:hypothetical protein
MILDLGYLLRLDLAVTVEIKTRILPAGVHILPVRILLLLAALQEELLIPVFAPFRKLSDYFGIAVRE